ncbi:RNA polymerase sigma factor [Micromonospora andamanensis]|nr:sigma-70 family RNA polymerase sigma factor [Micromonospora andamanensis]
MPPQYAQAAVCAFLMKRTPMAVPDAGPSAGRLVHTSMGCGLGRFILFDRQLPRFRLWGRRTGVMETTTDPPELVRVYQDHRVGLLRLAYLLTGSREHSEDLVQIAFASAMPRWDRIEQPLAYLRRTIVNQAADHHRRAARERTLPVPEPVTYPPEVDETWAEIQRLSLVQRTVVILRFYEDLTLVEIAAVMARPPATVRSDLKRALEHLRKALNP